MKYSHLNIKSHYTLLDSLLKIEDIINLSKNHSFSAVCLCDINSTFGLSELYYKNKNLKSILGVELEFNFDNYILYAKNYQGLKSIYNLTSLVNAKKLTVQDILDNSSNLVCLLTPKSKVYLDYINKGEKRSAINLTLHFNNLYFMCDEFDNDKVRFCLENKIKPVYASQVKYASYNDKKYYDLLVAIKKGQNYLRDKFGKREYFYSYDEVCQFATTEMLQNIDEIIGMCNVEIPGEMLIPNYSEQYNSEELLVSLCKHGLQKRIKVLNDVYIKRLKYELNTICKMGFANYFLIVYDYVKYAKSIGILVGAGRGSAAGSLVAYVLGITEVDPIKFNLLFERFLNPKRINLPDIDVDFEDTKRDDVVSYLVEKYGSSKVGAISTFSTFTSKQVLRDCAKAFGKNSVEIKYLTASINPNFSLKNNYSNVSEFRQLIDSDVNNEMIYQYALRLEGIARHNSIHAAGIVISKSDLYSKIGMLKQDRCNAICATMENIESMGLIKMDLLGLRNLTILNEILGEINKTYNVSIDIYNLNLEDSKVLELFESGNTSGIFQFESAGMQTLLRKLKPKKFMDLVTANALHRPGPMEYIDEFVARAHGKRFSYIDESLQYILEETYGIIVFQEQIMQLANKVANFSYAQADILRSAMSKKDSDKLIGQKQLFIEAGIANGYSLDIVNRVFEDILKFANYGFNKAHAVSYSMIGYILGYMKCYYPSIFNVALMNSSISNHNKILKYINECRVNNMEIVGVNINTSIDKFFVHNEKLVMPLTLVKGISKLICKSIEEERNNRLFDSFHDFVMRMAKYNIKQSHIENLIFANAFSGVTSHNKKTLIKSVEGIIEMVEFDSLILTEEFVYGKFVEYPPAELINYEKAVLGFNFSLHPTSIYTSKMEMSTLNVRDYVNHNVRMFLYVESIRVVKTKKGDNMAFLSCSDVYGTIDAVCFPKTYENYKVSKGDIIYVYGKLEYRNDRVQLIMENIKVRSD